MWRCEQHPEHDDDDTPPWVSHILQHIRALGDLMTEAQQSLESKVAAISADLDDFAKSTADALGELKATIAANPTQSVSTIDFTSVDALKAKADALVASSQAEAAADAPAQPAPTPGPAPTDQGATTNTAGGIAAPSPGPTA